MARNRIITIDKERMFADLKNFKTIIQGYVSQIDLLESENL